MTLIHLVQFKFKPEASEAAIRDLCDRIFGLKDKCIHATSQEPYIKSVTGGRDNSIEGRQDVILTHGPFMVKNGFTHAFVVEFESREDRDYYVKADEAHLGLVAGLGSLVAGAQVVDFTPGEY